MEAAQTTTFFPGSNRRVVLGSPAKHITSNRICIPIRMPLTGESVVGMPGWVAEAYDAVSKFAKEMSPEIEQVSDISLAFINDGNKGKTTGELFENPNAKASGSEMKNFTVLRVGDPDGDPVVELQFKAYMPFARDLWRWVGEMAGKEVYMAFPSTTGKAVSIVHPDAQEKLPMDAANPESTAQAADREYAPNPDDVPEPPAIEEEFGAQYEDQVRKSLGAEPAKPRMVDARRRGKSGPKELKEYHEKHGAAAPKGGVQSKPKTARNLAVN